jgi:hypothetical protein
MGFLKNNEDVPLSGLNKYLNKQYLILINITVENKWKLPFIWPQILFNRYTF